MRSIIAAAGAALVISGCGQPQQQQSEQSQPIAVRSAEQERLHELNDLNRAIALKRAIYDAGYTCQRITESGFAATYENLDMWVARCADRRDWAIFTGPDGTAQVRYCRDVEEMGLPACTIRERPQPAKAG